MSMKTMRGFIDPYTLGFLIAAAVGAMGVHTDAKVQQAQANVQQASAPQQGQVQPVNAVYMTNQQ
ncbi:hypothetical protein [Thiothrix nivea]|uniref:Uncharacterized protein n=1 Tax=Thiothrix nivea (strain ATCC 35100 / DSM 5205 / JP2) TaxID=870187 RepID=A0A656HF80_THINJ|nr:hypothetical protein [Thiothrix nivea]EIJ35087.1 hypothetical protein Thini_2544 [Thiothrix nivea DSM 5205]